MNLYLVLFFQEIIYQKCQGWEYVINFNEYDKIETHWLSI